MKSSVKVIFFGTSEFAVPILEKLAASSWWPDLVISTPDAPAGRGLKPKPPPVKVAAERFGIPIIQPPDLKIENWPALGRARARPGKLKIQDTDLFIVAAYGKILPAELLKIPKHGSLNIHPSLLPRWRGPSPVQYTIFRGDEEAGVTIILMDEEVDHGPIIGNAKYKMQNAKLTAPELTQKLAILGAELLLETVPEWLAGKITPQPQDETKATYAPRLKKEDGRIDWSHPAEEIERMVRAFQPWPGAYTFWQHGENQLRLVIERAASVKRIADSPDLGKTVKYDGDLAVGCGEGILLVKELKPEGRNLMSGQEFLRGHPDIVGAVLE